MKISLEKVGIYLTPENYADKMYIARFIKKENNRFKNIEATYKSEIVGGGGGYLNPERLLKDGDEYEDECDTSISIDEINGLNIFSDKI